MRPVCFASILDSDTQKGFKLLGGCQAQVLPAQPTKNSLLEQAKISCGTLHCTNMRKPIAAQEGSQLLRRQRWRVWLEHLPQASHENEKAAPHNQVTFDLTSASHEAFTELQASLELYPDLFYTHQGILPATDQTVNFMEIY